MADTAATVQPTVAAPEDLQLLIQQTNALSPAEKQYWLQLLPTMNETQVQQLRGILQEEQQNLAQIDEKYYNKLQDVAQKYLHKWDNQKAQKQRKEQQEKEIADTEEAHSEAEALLENW